MSEHNGITANAKAYHPRDHLVKIKTKEGLKDYYPAAWRLYELTLRHPSANFMSQIVHLDVERDFVIVKCCLYLGSDYALSDRKTEALKQGRLSALDKVETAAKARCARDFGISTELALDGDDLEADDLEVVGTADPTVAAATPQSTATTLPLSLDALKALVWSVYHIPPEQQTPNKWVKYKASVLGSEVPDTLLSDADRARLHGHALGQQKRLASKQTNGH